jgi:hypothetical protein
MVAHGLGKLAQKESDSLSGADTIDQAIMEQEKKKMHAKIAVTQWAGTEKLLGQSTLLKQETEVGDLKFFEAKHSEDFLSFVELVRFLNAVEKAEFAQLAGWSFLLYEREGAVLPGSLVKLGKTVLPLMSQSELVEEPSVRK